MAWFTPKVEINFADLNAAANWVDVTQWVQTISTSRGRSTELDRFSGGTMNLTLDNRDRRFDPTYTSSPYYPNVKPRRQIRLTVLISLTTYTIWTGYVSGWPQSVDYRSKLSTVNLSCYDAFGLLGQERLEGSAYKNYLASLNPTVWYRLNDTDTDQLVIDEYGRSSMTAYGSVQLEVASVPESPVLDANKCAYFDGAKGGISTSEALLPEGWNFGAIVWSMKARGRAEYDHPNLSSTTRVLDATVMDFGSILRVNLDMPDEAITGNLDRRGRLYAQILVPGGAGATVTVANDRSIIDETWHHFVYTFDGTTIKLYQDGVLVDTDTGFAGDTFTGNNPTVFGERFSGAFPITRGYIGFLADFAILSFVPADSTVAEMYQAFRGFPGQKSDARVGAILDFIGWPLAQRYIGDGAARLKSVGLFDGSVLDNLQKIAESEGGGFYVERDGFLRFRPRYFLITDSSSTTDQTTFGDGVGETRYLDAPMTMDEAFVFNEATFGIEGSKNFKLIDTSSRAKYGPRAHPDRTGMLNQSDNDAITGAEYVILNYAEPLTRITDLSIDPRIDTNTFTWCVVLNLGFRVAVKRTPQGVGSPWTVSTYVESIRHDIDLQQRTWQTKFTLSQKGANTTNYFKFGSGQFGVHSLAW